MRAMRDDVETRSFGMSGSDVAAIDSWLEEIGARRGASQRAIFAVRLCIAELAANAVQHGVARTDADHMVVKLRRLGSGIEVDFLDSRAPFDPTGPARGPDAQSLESASPGGRGMMLLQAYAIGLTYSHDCTYNRVHLTINSNYFRAPADREVQVSPAGRCGDAMPSDASGGARLAHSLAPTTCYQRIVGAVAIYDGIVARLAPILARAGPSLWFRRGPERRAAITPLAESRRAVRRARARMPAGRCTAPHRRRGAGRSSRCRCDGGCEARSTSSDRLR